MRILAIDIETSPNLAYVWGLWDQNVNLGQLVESGEMLCWAAKWIGEDEILFASKFHGTKKAMVNKAWKLLDEADVVLHFNGRRFDVPWLQREFLEFGLLPPSPFKHIDLLDTCKRQFRFPSNKLEYVSKRLGLEGKIKHEGFELWVKCMAGDADAWERMKEYNVRDVTELEELYAILKPWIKSHPSHGAMTGEDVCPKCGCVELQKRGYSYTGQSKFQRFQCKGCGAYSRSTKSIERAAVVEITG